MKTWYINNDTLEYDEKTHLYLVNGIVVPSVSKILSFKFKDKYKDVPSFVLEKAAKKGTELHEAIELYCRFGLEKDLIELQNFKILQQENGFEVVNNEIPVIIYLNKRPVCAGRLDLLLRDKDNLYLADIKRTSELDEEYLKYQLNLYKIGYEQSYHSRIKGLKGVYLREKVYKYINIPVDTKTVKNYLKTSLNAIE